MFDSVFRFTRLKTAVFRVLGLPRFAGFIEFSLWFLVFVNNDGGFSDFFVQCILALSVRAFISVLDEIYCIFAVLRFSAIFCAVLARFCGF